jgi:hypothetical protein
MGEFLVLGKGLYTLTLSSFPAMELNKCSIREMGGIKTPKCTLFEV